ncbi:MAG: adenylate/guanylate cyclase domain-containing protein, partial [Pseudonocardiaceae bacterium]
MDAGSIEQATFHLPVGTATFMLADIEPGRLRESASGALAVVVAHHYELLDEAISQHGGVRRQQDEEASVVAAFTRASDAVAAALDVQRAVQAESQPDRTSVKLRIGLHTAEAQRRDEGDYFGHAVNPCARLRAIAHGGQVVL